jgi:release factor glutamine methyltransferase
MDISSGALQMAQKNAKKHGVDARFILGDITKDLPNEKFDLIISHPPYIPSADINNLSPEVKKEPLLALDGGDDGLDLVRFLVNDGVSYLNDGGKMIVEFGYDQENAIRALLDSARGFEGYEILYDYGKNPRAFVIYK